MSIPRRLVAGFLGGALLLTVGACGADDPDAGSGSAETYYEGKTIEIIVPFAAGGSSDLTARFVAPFLKKHIPGNPTVQVINVDGNGDHRVGANQYMKEDPDGTKLLAGSGSTHSAFLYKAPNVEYDLNKLTPLMAFPLGCVIFAHPDTGLKTAADVLKPATQLFHGGREAVGGDLYRVSAFHVLGMNVKELWGYEGRGEMQVAYDQAELNIAGETTPSFIENIKPQVEKGLATPLFTLGQIEGPDLVRDPAFPDLPHIGEVYEQLYGKPASSLGLQWEAYKLQVAAALTVSKSLWVHGDVPQEAKDALLGAIEALTTDAEFLEAADAELGGYKPVIGADLDEAIKTHLQTVNAEAVDWLRKDVTTRYGIELE